MRITFLANAEVLSGGERYFLLLAYALSDRVEVVVAGAPGSPLLQAAHEHGLRTSTVNIGPKLGRKTVLRDLAGFPIYQARLRRAVEEATDHGWLVMEYKWEEFLWAGSVHPQRVALLEHGPIPAPLLRFSWSRRRLERAFGSAAVVLAASGPAERALRELGADPIRIPTGIESERVEAALAAADSTRLQLGIPADGLLLAYAGRLADNKGVYELVDAAIASDDLHVILVGDGPARDRLQQRAAETERVHLTGYVPDALPYLAAADVTALLTRDPGEGRPLVALESAAVGTPVVGPSSSPAILALDEEIGSCLVVASSISPGDVRRAVNEAFMQGCSDRYGTTWEDVADQFLDILADVR